MKALVAILSILFGGLFLVAFLLTGLVLEKETPLNAIHTMLILAIGAWLLFVVFNVLCGRIHPKAYLPVDGSSNTGLEFTIPQALVSAIRSGIQCIAVPLMASGILIVLVSPWLFIALPPDTQNLNVLVILLQLLVISIIGFLIEWCYKKTVVGFMNSKSGQTSHKRKSTKRTTKKRGIRFKLLDGQKTIKRSKRAMAIQHRSNTTRRWLASRNLLPPIFGVISLWMLCWQFGLRTVEGYPSYLVLVPLWILLLLIAMGNNRFRLTDRAPFRQMRLAIGLGIQALTLLVLFPVLLIVELPGKKGRTAHQWRIIEFSGRRISAMLRAPWLYWTIALLVTAGLFGLEYQIMGENVLHAILSGLAGILVYSATYKLLNAIIHRQKGDFQRLVFLRVFGDAGRGKFLFSHIAPRWKGMGSITCIAAPDVSIHQLDSDIGFDLLFDRLGFRFLVQDEATWVGRHIGSNQPGIVIEDHCFDDTWEFAVKSMFTQHSTVLMDLRGFTAQRKGCIHELGILRDHYAMESVVFLVDESTDIDFLQHTLRELWKQFPVNSNLTKDQQKLESGDSQITIFKMGPLPKQTAKHLIQLLIEASISGEKHHQAHGRIYLEEIVAALQLLAADASVQLKTAGNRTPGKKILEAGYSFDHDLGYGSFLLQWNLIDEAQLDILLEVNDYVQDLRNGGTVQLSAKAIQHDADWKALRTAAKTGLKALGKRKIAPTTIKK
ncbi:MAG: hypothetical protein AAFV80_07280 [Bacteroidota bacterium]